MLKTCLRVISICLAALILQGGKSEMSLNLTITVEKTQYHPGESIPVNMVLKNEAGRTVVIGEFTFNSDLTGMLVFDSNGKLVASQSDYDRQELLDFFPLERIDAPPDNIGPGQERRRVWDISQYTPLLKPDTYNIQGSYQYHSDKILSDPIEIEIVDGAVSQVQYVWQYEEGSKHKCYLVYRDGSDIMLHKGYKHNPMVIDYNYPLAEKPEPDKFGVAKSSYDKSDYGLWMVGIKDDKLAGYKYRELEKIGELEKFKIGGEIVFDALVETYDRLLVVPEKYEEQGKHYLCLHIFSPEGEKTAEKKFEISPEARIFDAADIRSTGYLLVYGNPVGKGFDVHAVSSKKADLSDLRSDLLYNSEHNFESVQIPPGYMAVDYLYGAAFKADSKELWLYQIELNPKMKTQTPPKRVVKSAGDLAFVSFIVEANGAAYMLFREEGHKLLYYNYTDDEFVFITEDKFSGAQLVATDSAGIFLVYIDKNGMLRFRQTETVMQRH